MSYKTDMAKVRGMGTAGEGVHHWWMHRISSVALIPLTLLAICPFVQALGNEHPQVMEIYQRPGNAIFTILFIITMFHHLMQGLQVVIEDYIHGAAVRTGLLLGVTFMCWTLGLAGVFAVAKIAFSA